KPLAALEPDVSAALQPLLSTSDFKGKGGEIGWVYPPDRKERFLLVGLGKKITAESLRCSYAAAVKSAMGKQLKCLFVMLPLLEDMDRKMTIQAVAEGMLLANYLYRGFKKKSEEEGDPLQEIHWLGVEKGDKKVLEKALTVCSAV